MTQWHAYRAIESEGENPVVTSSWQLVDNGCLPPEGTEKGEGEVLIKVQYSSVNYKDALSASGNRGVTRHFPHTPGIDAAGTVVSDASGLFEEGAEVVLFGYDLGMNTCGGYGEYIRIPAAWVLAKPANLSLEDSMRWGTAGFTAALSVEKLLKADIKPDCSIHCHQFKASTGFFLSAVLFRSRSRFQLRIIIDGDLASLGLSRRGFIVKTHHLSIFTRQYERKPSAGLGRWFSPRPDQ